MNWSQYIDAYCERVTPGLWAEPLNAATNAAFLIAAAIVWKRTRGQADQTTNFLAILLGVIGIGSFLFHTAATAWASMADVVPIGMFVFLYLYAANRAFLGLGRFGAGLATLGFVPFAAAVTATATHLPGFFQESSAYWSLPPVIFIYAVLLAKQKPANARGLAIGGSILTVSIVMRSLDPLLCTAIPIGTHFVWHLMNAIMLGWMIEVYHRQRNNG